MGLFSFKDKTPKKIFFRPYDFVTEAAKQNPISAASALVKWYKELRKYVGSTHIPFESQGASDLKTCSPFRDAMISGYLLTLPFEIEVACDINDDPDILWNPELNKDVVRKRGDITLSENQGFGMPVPAGYHQVMFSWSPYWAMETPKNYSILITHPLNRYDLPFLTTSGIIDSDNWTEAGQIPFFIKKGFSGVIEKGTPIAQVIPFKRDEWEKEIHPLNPDKNQKNVAWRDSYIHGAYVRFKRQKKSYK